MLIVWSKYFDTLLVALLFVILFCQCVNKSTKEILSSHRHFVSRSLSSYRYKYIPGLINKNRHSWIYSYSFHICFKPYENLPEKPTFKMLQCHSPYKVTKATKITNPKILQAMTAKSMMCAYTFFTYMLPFMQHCWGWDNHAPH